MSGLRSLGLLLGLGYVLAGDQFLLNHHASLSHSFAREWDILGPFQIGTREATWGADPLEKYGGFRALQYDPNATFFSSLATNGTVGWSSRNSQLSVSDENAAVVDLNVAFPDVDWQFLKAVYGWAAHQWQAWARGGIIVDATESQNYVLYTDNVLEFCLDGEPYFGGDMYACRKAPVVLTLAPGRHQLDIRLVRDVRAMGGTVEPDMTIKLELRAAENEVELDEEHLMLSDVVDGELASPYASIPFRITGASDVEVIDVNSSESNIMAALSAGSHLLVKAGQTRPIAFTLHCRGECPAAVNLTFTYKGGGVTKVYHLSKHLHHVHIYDVHKFTFLHPAGVVSYAMLRAPADLQADLPILLNLHGAGLEADNPQLTQSLDKLAGIAAWTLFPTGGTPWSGDDWHQWGWRDVEAAINALPQWRNASGRPDTTRWLVAGHSNGGQGVWHALLHHPDSILAAVPISGYLSIQKYVPYSLWHEADPAQTAVIQAALLSYRHELLISNAQGIPIMQEHGGADDNVPAYHSRRMRQLLNETGWKSGYVELPGKGHWFDGIMTTEPLLDFYNDTLSEPLLRDDECEFSFTLTSANPGDTGSKHGFRIVHLVDPGKLGKLEVVQDRESLKMITSNVEHLKLPVKQLGSLQTLTIDGQTLLTASKSSNKPSDYRRDPAGGTWHVVDAPKVTKSHRQGRQLGRLDAILKSNAAFSLASDSIAGDKIALQVARNLFQYFGADAELTAAGSAKSTGNRIMIVGGANVAEGCLADHPVRIKESTVSVRDDHGFVAEYSPQHGAVGAIYLRPQQDEALELVIWGVDEEGLRLAARLMPMLTGVGQPEFIVLSKDCAWKGIEGVLAMGFFDSRWNVSRSSFFS